MLIRIGNHTCEVHGTGVALCQPSFIPDCTFLTQLTSHAKQAYGICRGNRHVASGLQTRGRTPPWVEHGSKTYVCDEDPTWDARAADAQDRDPVLRGAGRI